MTLISPRASCSSAGISSSNSYETPIPDHYRPRSVFSFRNDTFEIGIFQRVIFSHRGKPLHAGIKCRSLRHRPRDQHTVNCKAEIIVQMAGIMLLDNEGLSAAGWLRSSPKIPLLAVLLKRHNAPPVGNVSF